MAYKLIETHSSDGVIQFEDTIRHALAGIYVGSLQLTNFSFVTKM